MDFYTFDKQMRSFEQSLDRSVPKGIYLVARLDGKGFTKLTKKILDLEKPFDIRFHNAMVNTTKSLMNCGFHILYGYTQSDEISLLFHMDDESLGHKERKLLSILAGQASATFSKEVGRVAVFDCRLIPLPKHENVIDYFRWRQEDATRNALSSYCYWALRKEGLSARKATKQISGIPNRARNEVLLQKGIDFNDVPSWQKIGVGIYYETIEKDASNPVTNENVTCLRKVLHVDDNLPTGRQYAIYVYSFLI